jgi:hypothetical protein
MLHQFDKFLFLKKKRVSLINANFSFGVNKKFEKNQLVFQMKDDMVIVVAECSKYT